MGLLAVLVDQARAVERVADGPRVEGQTIITVIRGEWFKARLFLEQAPETADEGGHPRTLSQPTFLMGVVDLQGNPASVSADDRLEFHSVQLGDAIWEVIDDPQPIRKRRRVIGYYGTLRLVEEHEADL